MKRELKPDNNITNNVASKAIRTQIEEINTKLQPMEPHNNKVNAAERTKKCGRIILLWNCAPQTPSISQYFGGKVQVVPRHTEHIKNVMDAPKAFGIPYARNSTDF